MSVYFDLLYYYSGYNHSTKLVYLELCLSEVQPEWIKGKIDFQYISDFTYWIYILEYSCNILLHLLDVHLSKMCCTKMNWRTRRLLGSTNILLIWSPLLLDDLLHQDEELDNDQEVHLFKCKVDILDFDSRSHLQSPADQGAFVHTRGLTGN